MESYKFIFQTGKIVQFGFGSWEAIEILITEITDQIKTKMLGVAKIV